MTNRKKKKIGIAIGLALSVFIFLLIADSPPPKKNKPVRGARGDNNTHQVSTIDTTDYNLFGGSLEQKVRGERRVEIPPEEYLSPPPTPRKKPRGIPRVHSAGSRSRKASKAEIEKILEGKRKQKTKEYTELYENLVLGGIDQEIKEKMGADSLMLLNHASIYYKSRYATIKKDLENIIKQNDNNIEASRLALMKRVSDLTGSNKLNFTEQELEKLVKEKKNDMLARTNETLLLLDKLYSSAYNNEEYYSLGKEIKENTSILDDLATKTFRANVQGGEGLYTSHDKIYFRLLGEIKAIVYNNGEEELKSFPYYHELVGQVVFNGDRVNIMINAITGEKGVVFTLHEASYSCYSAIDGQKGLFFQNDNTEISELGEQAKEGAGDIAGSLVEGANPIITSANPYVSGVSSVLGTITKTVVKGRGNQKTTFIEIPQGSTLIFKLDKK